MANPFFRSVTQHFWIHVIQHFAWFPYFPCVYMYLGRGLGRRSRSKGLRTLVALGWKSHGYTPEVLIFYFDFLQVSSKWTTWGLAMIKQFMSKHRSSSFASQESIFFQWSKTKTKRHVSLAWQAMKLHETFGLAKTERQDVVSTVSTSHKRNGPHDNKRTKAPITLNSWTQTQTKEMCNLGSSAHFPPVFSTHLPGNSAQFNCIITH